eukprot:TRINITY_DN28867_c0_g1_i2.p1 TRINITY_DN28867_c0_g1~~TRINITY_DN28867_c0_g1_i2.p1  ORF type:complete len:541 (-),score=91.05 TRINITY_DN28867_c0_g1_i2:289-1869(-)
MAPLSATSSETGRRTPPSVGDADGSPEPSEPSDAGLGALAGAQALQNPRRESSRLWAALRLPDGCILKAICLPSPWLCPWPLRASDTSHLMLLIVFTWSVASHVTHEAVKEKTTKTATAKVDAEDLEEAFPLELLEEIVLPFLGLGVGAIGVQFMLALTLAEPLLLLRVPRLLFAAQAFHERMLSWHLGGIFGQPMLVAQVAILRAETEASQKAAAFGALVGSYGCGAVAGSTLRRVLQIRYPGQPHVRDLVVLGLTLLNLIWVVQSGDLLGSHSHESSEDERAPIGRQDSSPTSKWWLRRKLWKGVRVVGTTTFRILEVAGSCRDILLARAVLALSLSFIVETIPLSEVDLFSWLPLQHGFRVELFDLCGVISSGLAVPLALGAPFRLASHHTLLVGLRLTVAACILAVLARLFSLWAGYRVAITAGLALSAYTSFVSPVLAIEAAERVEVGNQGVALGWCLFASGFAKLIGPMVGDILRVNKSCTMAALAAALLIIIGWQVSPFSARAFVGFRLPRPAAAADFC